MLLVNKGTSIVGGFVPLAGGLLAAGAAILVGRRYPDQRMTVTMVGCYGTILLGASAALFTPGYLDAPQLISPTRAQTSTRS
ncbi:MAG TPA: hypothetical protein VK083_12155 [Nocardia sp.]|uniref:hypothetical protein n=1 Tax=Nocardia TaxID=1817 RepID=UPI0024573934|nr:MULTISPECIES: hypothetical protein [Nocardia]HLS77533.1 hypothetical protein [Nocardia sp.]